MTDLTGQRFGRLIVLSKEPKAPNSATRWLCQCDCGKQTITYGSTLTAGITRSCGCLKRRREIPDLTGQRFGRLVVVSREEGDATYSSVRWKCVCDCGQQKTVLGINLLSESTRSCGCIRRRLER